MADRKTLLPHQNQTFPQMDLHGPSGQGKTAITPDLIMEIMLQSLPGTGKTRPFTIMPFDHSGSMECEPMTEEERAAVNRGIDDMINDQIANDARVAEVYAKLRSRVSVPTPAEKVFNKLKGGK
jgi:hypothetical protein